MLELRAIAYDHPDAARLIAELQRVYVHDTAAGRDPGRPREFAAPGGFFVVGYVDGAPVACGGWRARDAGPDPELRDGDAEIKRMFVVVAHRGRGFARAVLAELERTAARGRRRGAGDGHAAARGDRALHERGVPPMRIRGLPGFTESRYFAKPRCRQGETSIS